MTLACLISCGSNSSRETWLFEFTLGASAIKVVMWVSYLNKRLVQWLFRCNLTPSPCFYRKLWQLHQLIYITGELLSKRSEELQNKTTAVYPAVMLAPLKWTLLIPMTFLNCISMHFPLLFTLVACLNSVFRSFFDDDSLRNHLCIFRNNVFFIKHISPPGLFVHYVAGFSYSK